jgi:hypothetical protein
MGKVLKETRGDQRGSLPFLTLAKDADYSVRRHRRSCEQICHVGAYPDRRLALITPRNFHWQFRPEIVSSADLRQHGDTLPVEDTPHTATRFRNSLEAGVRRRG